MSGDALCVGVCMMDWETGVCLGCGRTADEIYGTTDAPEVAPDAEVPASGEAAASDDGGKEGKDEA